jgi:hypothetical protein
MAHNPDLTLPPTAPADYLSQQQESDTLPTVLYTLVPLSNDELHNVARTCELECELDEGEVIRPAPEPHFISQPLRAVYESHLRLGTQGEFEPFYFVVVVHQNWRENGLLLVTLYSDDDPPAIDSFFCKSEGVGITVQNLQIANSDWCEAREQNEIGLSGEEDDDDDDDDETDADEEEKESDIDDKENVELPTDADEEQSDDEGPEYPSKKPAWSYLIPIYILESVDANILISNLEEDIHAKSDPFTDYRIRNQASLTPTGQSNIDVDALSKPNSIISEDLIAQACVLHPVRCRANKWLNKTYFLLCDNTQPSTSGLLIVKLDWDGVSKGRSKAQLREIGTTSYHESTRLPGTSKYAITYGYTMIAEGLAIFSRTHPAFAIFQVNADMPHHGVKLVDPEHWERKSRDEYFVVAGLPIELHSPSSLTLASEEKDMDWTLETAISKFPWLCYVERFEPEFNRQYFVWFDHETVDDEGVVVVRYDWDKDVERGGDELWKFRDLKAVKTIRLSPGQAMAKILAAAKNGSDDWAWEVYRG